MVHEFLRAALPWIAMGLFTAVSCAWMSEASSKEE